MGGSREEVASELSLKNEGKYTGNDGGKRSAGAKTGRWENQPEV